MNAITLIPTPGRRHVLAAPLGLLPAALAPAALAPAPARAQPRLAREQLLGSWQLVSAVETLPGGRRMMPYGLNPAGMLVFDRGGNFSWLQLSTDMKAYAAASRMAGTDAEYKIAALGTLAYFGTYELDPAGTLVTRIHAASFANLNGTTLRRPARLDGDRLTVHDPGSAASSGAAEVVWQRMR